MPTRKSGPGRPVRRTRNFSIAWDADLFQQIERAAAVLSKRELLPVKPVDVIRRGARREVQRILNGRSPRV